MKKVACLGECMLELNAMEDSHYQMKFGGDVLNTAIYIARLGGSAAMVTGLGKDKFSNELVNAWQREKLDVKGVQYDEQKLPGLYAIETDNKGERSFYYWRSDSAARHLFSKSNAYFDFTEQCDALYISGITLSLFSDNTFEQFLAFIERIKQADKLVIFDLNYRPANWASKELAMSRVLKFLPHVDLALPSHDDHQVLFGQQTQAETLAFYLAQGVGELVLKNGEDGCYYACASAANPAHKHYPLKTKLKPVDTTAAGDSFNAGYITPYLQKKSIDVCVAAAQACSAQVIMHKGAIIDAKLFEANI